MLENSIKYIIITPAYNEAAYIEYTIRSVLAQSILPYKWVIVDDSSTDDTAKIIQQYAAKYNWIQYIYRAKKYSLSYYQSNVHAILEGYEKVKCLDFDFLAILDADITLCSDYYETIFKKSIRYPELGIATGTYFEKEGNSLVEARIDRRSTPKAIQVFRRECYEQIGGYIPFKNGGEDSGMEVMARMHGWQTWSFPNIRVIHNRPVGTGDGRSLLRARFRLGLTDYSLGTHPFFMVFKCARRSLWERPYIVSGFMRMLGFCYGYWKCEPRPLPAKAVQFLRKEQLGRLAGLVGIGRPGWTP